MKKILIIYHRIDFDGMCSMAIAKQWAEAHEFEVEVMGYNHGDPTPHINCNYDMVVVVDICLSAELMKELDSKTKLVWIDHHCTSINDSIKEHFDHVDGVRQEGVGACELCWLFFHSRSAAPLFIQYISAYDVWDTNRFDWEGITLPFQFGLRGQLGIQPDAFYEWYCQMSSVPQTISLISDGKAVIRYARECGRRACKAYGFMVEIGGKLRGLALLTGHFGVMEMEETMCEKGCQVAVCVNRLDSDGVYKVSLYAGHDSDGSIAAFNLGEYMQKYYAGGGHRCAAGGTMSEDQFLRLLHEKKM